ncbi:sigma-70 family RNA polymerase sigma factor [Streptomyces phaeochromogenes]|uniref:sigma-70 family RNA polymerase sigma factor n=1 Tax=Streptomyces phaeochromogenes TaxID=1923 RepID=UPI0033F577E2
MSWTFLGSGGHPDEEEEEFQAGYREQVISLHAYVSRLLGGDGYRAEDIVQETLFRCWRTYGTAGGTLLRPWLFTVARNLVIDAHRSRKARPQEVDGADMLEQEPTAVDDVETLLTSVVVTEAMKSLSAAHRKALYETYFLGNTLEEAAQVLGLPVGTVKSRVHYGLRALETALLAQGVEPGWPQLKKALRAKSNNSKKAA